MPGAVDDPIRRNTLNRICPPCTDNEITQSIMHLSLSLSSQRRFRYIRCHGQIDATSPDDGTCGRGMLHQEETYSRVFFFFFSFFYSQGEKESKALPLYIYHYEGHG